MLSKDVCAQTFFWSIKRRLSRKPVGKQKWMFGEEAVVLSFLIIIYSLNPENKIL